MPRRKIAVVLLTCAFALFTALALKLTGAGGNPAGIIDPDLSDDDVVSGLIDKTEYLKRRADHFLSLRGWGEGETFDPHARARAIAQLEEQEQNVMANLTAAARSAGPNSAESFQLAVSSQAWTELGPAPIPNGQTEVFETPVSGRTISIAVHPDNPNIAFVGTAQGGLYRTLDGGNTWKSMMDNAQSLAIGALAFASPDANGDRALYIGTGEANLSADSFFGVGLYRMNDALALTPQLTGPINPPVTTGIAGTTAFSGVAISKIVVHPTDPATIFVSTSTATGGNPSGGSLSTTVPPVAIRGLYRSTNATAAADAVAFQKLTVTPAGSVAPDTSGNRNIIDMVMEPGVPNRLICTVVGTSGTTAQGDPDGGVYVTSNALAPTPTFTRTLALGNATAVVANEGRAELAIQKTSPPAGTPVVTVYVASGESAAPGTANCGTGGTLRRSSDGGNTWTPPLPQGDGFCGAQCFYDIALAVDPTDPLGVLLGGNVTGPINPLSQTPCTKLIARSNDGGANFVPTNAGVHADNQVVVFAPSDPSRAYMGTDGGIYRSDDGGNNWTPMNNTTFKATQFQSIATHPTDRNIMLGGTQDNGTIKMYPDGTFRRTDSGDGGYALFDRNSTSVTNAIAYHTTQAGGSNISWRRSTNSGDSWTNYPCGSNGIPCSEPVQFYPPITLGPGNPSPLYYGTQALYRSSNGTTAAQLISQRPITTDAVPPATPVAIPLTTIAIAPQNDNVRLVGSRNGKVFATTNASTTLTNVTTSALPTPNPNSVTRPVSRAVIHPTDQKTAYITFGGYNVQNGHHIMKTTNLDTSDGAAAVEWTPSGFGIPDVPVNSIIFDRVNPANMYVGTDIGVYRSIDAGVTWTPFSSGLPRIAVFDLAFQEQVGSVSTDQVLRVATHGRGIWEMTIPAAAEPSPSPSPSPSVSPTPEPSASPTVTPTPEPSATPTITPIPTVPPTPTPSPSVTPSPSPSPSAIPSASPSPSPTASPSPSTTPVPSASPTPSGSPALLVNIASRLRVERGDRVLIGGFIVRGSSAKRVFIRAIGPSLKNDGNPVPGRLDDPTLELFDRDGTPLAFNDNWQDSEARDEIANSGLAPEDERDAVIAATLEPDTYTAIMRGKDESTGIGLLEIYDRTQDGNAELANLSSRGFVETDDNVLIGGFILGSQNAGTRVLLRAIGPSLKPRLADALDDPELEIFDRNGSPIAFNDNWKDSDRRSEIEETGIAPSEDAESAVLLDAPPASYTAIVRGRQRASGVGVVEIYNVK